MTVRAGLDARQAARALRITRATLYAYVSRADRSRTGPGRPAPPVVSGRRHRAAEGR